MKKRFIWLTFFIVILILLQGCSLFVKEEAKSFSKSGMTIELTNKFSEVTNEPYTVCYNSKKIAVFALKEEFTLFSGIEYNLKEYAEVVINNNSLTSEVKEENGLISFEFSKTVNEQNINYIATVYKTSDSYWLF